MCGKDPLFQIPGRADLWRPLLDCQHHSGGKEDPAATLIPESPQEEQPGGEAGGDVIQSHRREHPGVLHHSMVRGMLDSRKENTAESHQHSPEDHWLLFAQSGCNCQLSLPQQSQKHN